MAKKSIQTIAVNALPIIVYQDQRVITTELLAKCYGAESNHIQQNFTRNENRFTPGQHYFKLEGETLKEFKSLHNASNIDSVGISPQTRNLTLWTERGAARHAKMLDTDQAWEVFGKLEDAYFGGKKTATTDDTQGRYITAMEVRAIEDIVDRRIEEVPASIREETREKILTSIARWFRIDHFEKLPRIYLADALIFVGQMEVFGVPIVPVSYAYPLCSKAQRKELTEAVKKATSGWIFDGGRHNQYVYNKLRIAFDLRSIADLPASQFEDAIELIELIGDINGHFLRWITEVRDYFLDHFMTSGEPWTTWLEHNWEQKMLDALPEKPDWPAIYAKIKAKDRARKLAQQQERKEREAAMPRFMLCAD